MARTKAIALAASAIVLGAAAGIFLERTRSGAEATSATSAAWRGVSAHPNDVEAWLELGDTEAAADRLNEAERAYRTAIRLGGDGTAYGRLGFLLYAQEADREAFLALREAKRRGAVLPMLDETLAALTERLDPAVAIQPAAPAVRVARAPRAGPAPDAGFGALDAWVPQAPDARPCSIPAERRSNESTYFARVFVDGVDARLVMDTGASLTLVTEALAAATGAKIDRERPVRAVTAQGRTEFPTAVLNRLEVGGRVATNVRVAVCAECGGELGDGLLGLDVQRSLGMRLDPARARIDFTDCE